MPHYKDGTEAHLGDKVVGKTANTPKDQEIVGEIVELQIGEACNAYVAHTVVLDVPEDSGSWLQGILYRVAGRLKVLVTKCEIAQTKELSLVPTSAPPKES